MEIYHFFQFVQSMSYYMDDDDSYSTKSLNFGETKEKQKVPELAKRNFLHRNNLVQNLWTGIQFFIERSCHIYFSSRNHIIRYVASLILPHSFGPIANIKSLQMLFQTWII